MAAGNTVVNTNVMALNTHRSLKNVGNTQAKASERLSSGLRINSAADDAAGLAISEKMRAQIRGLDMASKNSQDAISLIQTAEGGMQEIDNMLQRIRELIDYAANDTQENNKYGTGDRQKIQDEVDQLVEEIDSMAERVEFNKKKIINGSFSDSLGVLSSAADKLANAQNSLKIALSSRDSALTQKNNAYTDYAGLDSIVSRFESGLLAKEKALEVKQKALKDFTATAMVTTEANINASNVDAALANFVNELSDIAPAELTQSKIESLLKKYFVDADNLITNPDSTTATHTTAITDITWVTANKLGGTAAFEVDTVVTVLGDASAATSAGLKASINSVLAKVQDVYVAQKDLENYDTNKVAATPNAGTVTAGFFNAAANATNTAAPAAATAAGNTSYNTAGTFKSSADLYKAYSEYTVTMAKADDAYSSAAKEVTLIQEQISRFQTQIQSASDMAGSSSKLFFQVGANANQKLEMSIGSVKSDILGIGNGKGVTNIDVVRNTGADITGYLDIMDDALSYVTTERSKLGAAQNRLEYTIKSLDISSENLSSAESRIRDTDMAKEMMNFTKANVLQQAAISMLAQANQAPQNILQLLR